MSTPTLTIGDDDLATTLTVDLAAASDRLAAANLARSRKDTPAHRRQVTAAQARVDALLDLYSALS